LTRACTHLLRPFGALDAGGDGSTDEARAAATGGAIADVDLAVAYVVGEVVRGKSVVGCSGGWGIAFLGLGGWLGAGGEACENEIRDVLVVGFGDSFLVFGRASGICGEDCGAVRGTVDA